MDSFHLVSGNFASEGGGFQWYKSVPVWSRRSETVRLQLNSFNGDVDMLLIKVTKGSPVLRFLLKLTLVAT